MLGTTRRAFLTGGAAVSIAGLLGRSRTALADETEADGTWERGPDLPDDRTEVRAAALGDECYVVGGFVPPGDEDVAVTDGVAVYDPSDESWTEAAPMPRALHHVAVATIDDRLYVIGGYEGDFDPVDTVLVYDGEEWTEGEPMPTARGALAAGKIDDRIYVAGGSDGDEPFATLEIYDPDDDSWETGPDLPTAREHVAAGVLDDRLYVAGGRKDFDNVGVTEAYDPADEEWTEVASMPTPRSGHDAVTLDGVLYTFGGESAERTFDDVEAYDPDEEEWSALEPMPTARHGLGAAAVDGDIYVASGGPEPGFTYSSVLEILRLDA